MVCRIRFASPFRHLIYHPGVVKLLFYPFYCGFPVVVLPKFDPEQFCGCIERYKVTVAFVVPPIILVLVHHPGERELFALLHSLLALTTGRSH